MPTRSSQQPLTVVVIAGAVARGSYEAAALAELLPRVLDDLSNTIFIGTSAGAINAALWARFAKTGTALAEVGASVKSVWAEIEDDDVFACLSTTFVRDVLGLLTGFVSGRGLRTILNARPLKNTVTNQLHPEQIAQNLADGSVRGVGVVATACGSVTAGARSHVFLQQSVAGALPIPETSAGSSLDYYGEDLTVEHILASSAVPTLFAPQRIAPPAGSSRLDQWYIDGGVRLNTPIKPAIALNADRIIVVSSHADEYAPNTASPQSIAINDSLALVLHSVLADPMIEDLRRLRVINHLVAEARRQGQPAPTSQEGRAYREIPLIVVAPKPGDLATQARCALDGLARCSLHAARYRFLDGLFRFMGVGSGRDELLSYLFFDKAYSAAQFSLGQSDAQRIDGWELS